MDETVVWTNHGTWLAAQSLIHVCKARPTNNVAFKVSHWNFNYPYYLGFHSLIVT